MRWLGLLLAIGLAGTSADAQVFKPKGPKKTGTTEKAAKSTTEKKSTKQSARTSPGKKRVTTKPKKNQARSEDSESSPSPKESDKDFVKITDDDDVE